jgi:hypothetical protein
VLWGRGINHTVEFDKEHDSDGVAGWQGDLPEEVVLELRTEARVGVEGSRQKEQHVQLSCGRRKPSTF